MSDLEFQPNSTESQYNRSRVVAKYSKCNPLRNSRMVSPEPFNILV